MKKTKEHKELIRDNKMIPLFWHLACDSKNHLLVVNIFTGEYRVLEK